MTTEVAAVFVEDASAAWAGLMAGSVGFLVPDDSPATPGWRPEITYFRIGEGGWINNGAGAEPRTPSASLRRLAGETTSLFVGSELQDLDAVVDGDRNLVDQRYGADRRFTFEKALTALDITHPSEGVVQFTCTLDAGEANDNGTGASPQFWEIGLYCVHPDSGVTGKLLVAYATFPMIEKDALSPQTVVVTLYFKAQE